MQHRSCLQRNKRLNTTDAVEAGQALRQQSIKTAFNAVAPGMTNTLQGRHSVGALRTSEYCTHAHEMHPLKEHILARAVLLTQRLSSWPSIAPG